MRLAIDQLCSNEQHLMPTPTIKSVRGKYKTDGINGSRHAANRRPTQHGQRGASLTNKLRNQLMTAYNTRVE
jgi:hypothetical protein